MATLQNIRNRGVLIATVIGLALFAFIAGDAFKSAGAWFKGSQSEVAVIAEESVSIKDFQNKVKHNQNISQMMSGQSALSSEQMDRIREQTWQQLVQETIMTKEYEALGIDVEAQELFDLVQGENISPIIRQVFKDENGNLDKTKIITVLKQLMAAPDGSAQKMYWLNIEKQIKAARQLEKYNEFITKSLYITKASAKQSLEASSKKVDFSYIVKNYTSISDSAINVSEDEINEYYESHEYLFQQKETRNLAYVSFPIIPSEEDRIESEKYIQELVGEFAGTTDNKEYVNLNSDLKFVPAYISANEITNKELSAFTKKAKLNEMFGPYENNGSYSICKINDIKMLPDSVKARHILIQPINNDLAAAQTKADSIVKLLKRGAKFSTLANKFSADKGSADKGGDLGWFAANQMVAQFSDACFFAKKKDIKVVKTQYGVHVIQILNQTKKIRKAQLAIVSKTIEASQKTYNNIYSQAVKFAQSSTDLDSFNAGIEKEKYTKRIGSHITKNDKTLAGLEMSRPLIKDAYASEEVNKAITAKDGKAIYELGNAYVVAVLTDISEKGTSPIAKVASTIKRELIRRKKAVILSKDLASATKGCKSLLSLAQKQGLTVKEANDISFATFQVPGAGIEPKLIATATMTTKGQISAPIEGNQGVYVLVVNNEKTEAISEEAITLAQTQMKSMYMYRTQYQAMAALRKNANIEDKRYKFY
jgi:peptidyl-prolyl cis-trans isomerase D